MRKTMLDAHDLLAAESFLAAEARIAASFERTEEAIAPLLRSMRATGRTTYVTDPERGAIWGHAFLKPPYAPSAEADWFIAWGLRFPDGGIGWDGADPPLPRTPHAIVVVGGHGAARPEPGSWAGTPLPAGWSMIGGEAAFLAAGIALRELPVESDALVAALAQWTLSRITELKAALPGLAGG
jgi:hypothetical protein